MNTVTLVLLNTNDHIHINKFYYIGIFGSINRFFSLYEKYDAPWVINVLMSECAIKVKSDFFQYLLFLVFLTW